MKRLLILLAACGGAQKPVQQHTVGGVVWRVAITDQGFAVSYVDGASLITLENGDRPTTAAAPVARDQGDLPRVPAIEQADLDFAADTAKDGADGWVRHFDEHGAMWRKDHRVEGAAIKDAMTKTLAAGSLTWRPVTSGARGDLGFSVGTAEFTEPGGTPEHLTYCTIWKHEPDGGWKVLFDIGRPAT